MKIYSTEGEDRNKVLSEEIHVEHNYFLCYFLTWKKYLLIVSTYFPDFKKLNTRGKINTSSTKTIFNGI